MIGDVLAEEEFAVGEVLFNEGEPGECMYFLCAGKVAIYTGVPPKIRTLVVFEPGDFFGEMGLYDEKPRAASAMAKDSSRVLLLKKSDFCDLIAEYPPVALGIMKELNQRLRATNMKLNSFEGRFLDKATQLYNKEYFVDCTATEFLKSKKNGFPLSFLLVKITFEKFSADQAKSDYLLEQFMTDVGRVLTLHQRPTDLVARFSKQKVVALLAEATRPGAESFMERVKKDIDKQQGYFCEAHGVLVQVGFTIRNFPEDTPEREAMLSFLEQV